MAKLDYAARRYGLRETRRSAEAGCVLARRLASARGPPASQARAVRSNKGKNKPIIRTTPPPPPPPHSPGGGCPKNGDMYAMLASCATLGFALVGIRSSRKGPRCRVYCVAVARAVLLNPTLLVGRAQRLGLHCSAALLRSRRASRCPRSASIMSASESLVDCSRVYVKADA